jgi:hypothetical protein
VSPDVADDRSDCINQHREAPDQRRDCINLLQAGPIALPAVPGVVEDTAVVRGAGRA